MFPQASLTVHLRVTTVGQVPVATSIYVTEVIPHASEVMPLLGDDSNTTSVEEVTVVENGGLVIAPVLHPSIFLVTAQAVITGFVVSFTLIV